MVRLILCALVTLMSVGCATYDYAQQVKTVAFSDNLKKGESVGNIRGEDCTWRILGYQLGGLPTVDRAVMHAQNQTDGGSLTSGLNTNQTGGGRIRYINNMNTKNDGFDAIIVGKSCIVVSGMGYR